MTQPTPRTPISRPRMALYGAVNLPTSVVGLPISIYIPAFYSENLGLSLAAVGALIALSRLTDVVTDPPSASSPTAGRRRSGAGSRGWSWARRSRFCRCGCSSCRTASFPSRSGPPSAAAASANLYLFVWISLLYLGFTLVDLPYRAWGAEMSPDYHERSRITGWREAFGYGGTMLSLLIPLAIAYGLTQPGAENALFGVALAVLLLMPIMSAPAILFVKEAPPRARAHKSVGWRQGLRIVWRNGPFRRLVVCFMFFVVAISMTASMSFFFVRRVMEEPFERYALYILAYYLASTAAIPAWFAISRKIGKHRTVVLGIGWLSLWSASIPLLGPDQLDIFLVLMLFKGSAVGSLVFLPTSMAADIVDLDTLRTRQQRTGLYFSLWGMVNKGAAALGIFMATATVAWFGFDPASDANSDTAKLALACMYSVIPAGIACIALPMLWNYPLTHERQERMRAHIERRDARLPAVVQGG